MPGLFITVEITTDYGEQPGHGHFSLAKLNKWTWNTVYNLMSWLLFCFLLALGDMGGMGKRVWIRSRLSSESKVLINQAPNKVIPSLYLYPLPLISGQALPRLGRALILEMSCSWGLLSSKEPAVSPGKPPSFSYHSGRAGTQAEDDV